MLYYVFTFYIFKLTLFPHKFTHIQKFLLSKTTLKKILSSCDRITDSNLIVNTNTELDEIKAKDSKLIKDYLINYAKDKGVFGGIYYEQKPADNEVHLFIVEFFIFKDVLIAKDKIAEYYDFIGAVATPINNKEAKINNDKHYVSVLPTSNALSDMSMYKKNIQIEGLWLEQLDVTDFKQAYEIAKNKLSQNS